MVRKGLNLSLKTRAMKGLKLKLEGVAKKEFKCMMKKRVERV